MNVDSLITAGAIIPVVPEGQILQKHSLVIQGGKILDILPWQEAEQRYQAKNHYLLEQHTLIPGLINAHTHVGMTLLRGSADDLPLMTWLQEHIWPMEQKWVGENFVAVGTDLAIAEMIRSGTTCFNDMYFFPEITAERVTQAGMRAVIGLILIDFPSAWANVPEEYLQKGLALHEQLASNELLTTAFAPHAPYTVSDTPLSRVSELATHMNIPIHMHIHETADEVNQAIQQSGIRPLVRLDGLGLVQKQLNAVHMTQLLPEEISYLGEKQVNITHCPHSNMKLASGFCPVQDLLSAGANVALGTDSSASNNSLDMLAEMKTAALLAKGISQDATAVPAATALRMATLNGARALGIDSLTGSLEIGKQADITAIDTRCPEMQPLLNPLSQIVYASSREQVSHVWVRGKALLEEGQLTTIDQEKLQQQLFDWQRKLVN